MDPLYGSTLGFPVVSSALVCGSLSCTSSLQAPVSLGSTMICHPSGSAELPCHSGSALYLQVSSCASTFYPSGSARLLLPSGYTIVLGHTDSFLVYQAHIFTSVMRACGSTLALQALRITLVRHLLDSIRLSSHLSLWFLISTYLFPVSLIITPWVSRQVGAGDIWRFLQR